MKIFRDIEELKKAYSKAQDAAMDRETAYPGQTYEEGIVEAFEWILAGVRGFGDSEDLEFSEYFNP